MYAIIRQYENKGEKTMVKLTFDFDKEKLLERGLTEDGMFEEVREFAKENGIEEIAYGVSEKSGA